MCNMNSFVGVFASVLFIALSLASSGASAASPLEPLLVTQHFSHTQEGAGKLQTTITYDTERILEEAGLSGDVHVFLDYVITTPGVALQQNHLMLELNSEAKQARGAALPLKIQGAKKFRGAVRVTLEIGGKVYPQGLYLFWGEHSATRTTSISQRTFQASRTRTKPVVQSEASKGRNLEDGDVPGEGVKAPDEPQIRCGKGQTCPE